MWVFGFFNNNTNIHNIQIDNFVRVYRKHAQMTEMLMIEAKNVCLCKIEFQTHSKNFIVIKIEMNLYFNRQCFTMYTIYFNILALFFFVLFFIQFLSLSLILRAHKYTHIRQLVNFFYIWQICVAFQLSSMKELVPFFSNVAAMFGQFAHIRCMPICFEIYQ